MRQQEMMQYKWRCYPTPVTCDLLLATRARRHKRRAPCGAHQDEAIQKVRRTRGEAEAEAGPEGLGEERDGTRGVPLALLPQQPHGHVRQLVPRGSVRGGDAEALDRKPEHKETTSQGSLCALSYCTLLYCVLLYCISLC